MPIGRDNRRQKPVATPRPNPAPRLEAGARPLSGRQREHLSHLHAAQTGRPETVLHRTVTGVHRPDARPVHAPPRGAGNRVRSGAATAARQRAKRRANRKRINWAKVLLRTATTIFAIEVVAAVIFSPRLWVRTVTVSGNPTVATASLTKRLAIAPDTNLLKLLLRRNQMVSALRAEPGIATASIRPVFPSGIAVSVTEREPFAAVKFASEPGKWYTLDKNQVPFRTFNGLPEANLPIVTVAAGTSSGTKPGQKPVLGNVCKAPGLSDVGACLTWAKAQGGNFPVETVTIDSAGKLCLNRAGGMTVLLGPGIDLKEKLDTLSLLLTKRTDLCGSVPTDIMAVNLYAYDAPALVPKAPADSADATAMP